jgi:hypothetical protein
LKRIRYWQTSAMLDSIIYDNNVLLLWWVQVMGNYTRMQTWLKDGGGRLVHASFNTQAEEWGFVFEVCIQVMTQQHASRLSLPESTTLKHLTPKSLNPKPLQNRYGRSG